MRSLTQNKVYEVLVEPRTSREITYVTGLCDKQVHTALRNLRDSGLVYISGWVWGKRIANQVAVYSRGDDEDVMSDKDKARINAEREKKLSHINAVRKRDEMDVFLYGETGVTVDKLREELWLR